MKRIESRLLFFAKIIIRFPFLVPQLRPEKRKRVEPKTRFFKKLEFSHDY